MVKDFFIMLYLALTLLTTFRLIHNLGYLIKHDKSNLGAINDSISLFVPALLWAIWYMYIIN